MKMQNHDLTELETATDDFDVSNLEEAASKIKAVSALTSYMMDGMRWGLHVSNEDALYLISQMLQDAAHVVEDAVEYIRMERREAKAQ